MAKSKRDGSPGLLATGQLGRFIDEGLMLPDLTEEISQEKDPQLLAALYRDYCFLASAYLLEPCDCQFRATGEYGYGRDKLPICLSRPLTYLAEVMKGRPFLKYGSYALLNYRRKPKVEDGEREGDGAISQSSPCKNESFLPFRMEELELVRCFDGGPDESGFILVHVAIVSHTFGLVQAYHKMQEGIHLPENHLEEATVQNLSLLQTGLWQYAKTMSLINKQLLTMWKHSQPSAYHHFRTFIMGIFNQPMFPKGVVYESRENLGNSENHESLAKYFRGETGATDSIIPFCDALFSLRTRFPKNPLTQILRDFDTYRPWEHQQFLSQVKEWSQKVNFISLLQSTQDPLIFILLKENLQQQYDFRNAHWQLVRSYILRYSKHQVATGGSPIHSWLLNQLETIKDFKREVAEWTAQEFLRQDIKGKLILDFGTEIIQRNMSM